MPGRKDYMAIIEAAYARERSQLDREIAAWRQQIGADRAANAVFGYSPPRFPLHLAGSQMPLCPDPGRVGR